MGVQPAVGRTFTREDDEAARPVAVIGDAFWTRKFGRDPGAVGRVIRLDRQPYTIVGVMPRGFVFPTAGRSSITCRRTCLPIAFTPRERRAFAA